MEKKTEKIKNLSTRQREVFCNCYMCCCCPMRIPDKKSSEFYCKLDKVNLDFYNEEEIIFPEDFEEEWKNYDIYANEF